jgi:hypothetical protein
MVVAKAIVHSNQYGMDSVNKLTKLVITLAFLASSSAFALTKGQQVDKYILSAQNYFKEGKYSQAFAEFKNVEQVGIKLDDSFHYFYAVSGHKSGNHDKAWAEINQYLSKTGRSGQHYQKALELHKQLQAKVSRSAVDAKNEFISTYKDWKKLEGSHNLNKDVSTWASAQQKSISRLIEEQKYASAEKSALKNKERLDKYIDMISNRSDKLSTMSSDIAKIATEVRFNLITDQRIKQYNATLATLRGHFKALDFDSFDSQYETAQRTLAKEKQSVQTKKQQILRTAQQDAALMEQQMRCYSAKSKLAAHNTHSIDEPSTRSNLLTTINDNCNKG